MKLSGNISIPRPPFVQAPKKTLKYDYCISTATGKPVFRHNGKDVNEDSQLFKLLIKQIK